MAIGAPVLKGLNIDQMIKIGVDPSLVVDLFERAKPVGLNPGQKDPIYGYKLKDLPAEVIAILKTNSFARLNSIAQNSIKPGLRSYDRRHTRGPHSIGTAHLATRYYQKRIGVSLAEFSASAATHDIDHRPLSHTAEMAFDSLGHKGHYLNRLHNSDIGHSLQKAGCSVDRVGSLAFFSRRLENPIAKPRNRDMSIDHLDNLHRDIFHIYGDRLDWYTKVTLNAKNQLQFTDMNEKLAQQFVRDVIRQNEAIYAPGMMLVDMLAAQVMKDLYACGALSDNDLYGHDGHFFKAAGFPFLPEEVKLRFQLLMYLSKQSPEAVNNFAILFGLVSSVGKQVQANRTVKGTYVSTPVEINGVTLPERFDSCRQMVEDANNRFRGHYYIDVDKAVEAFVKMSFRFAANSDKENNSFIKAA